MSELGMVGVKSPKLRTEFGGDTSGNEKGSPEIQEGGWNGRQKTWETKSPFWHFANLKFGQAKSYLCHPRAYWIHLMVCCGSKGARELTRVCQGTLKLRMDRSLKAMQFGQAWLTAPLVIALWGQLCAVEVCPLMSPCLLFSAFVLCLGIL